MLDVLFGYTLPPGWGVEGPGLLAGPPASLSSHMAAEARPLWGLVRTIYSMDSALVANIMVLSRVPGVLVTIQYRGNGRSLIRRKRVSLASLQREAVNSHEFAGAKKDLIG